MSQQSRSMGRTPLGRLTLRPLFGSIVFYRFDLISCWQWLVFCNPGPQAITSNGSCFAGETSIVVSGFLTDTGNSLCANLPLYIVEHNDVREFVAKRRWDKRLREITSPQMMALVSQVEGLSIHHYQAMIVAYSGRA